MAQTDSNSGLYIGSDTGTEDIVRFVEDRVENPHEVRGSLVWNFSSHPVDTSAIRSVSSKERDRFAIPYQVTGAWPALYALLPERVREAEVLVYHTDRDDYVAFQQYYRTMPDERQEQVRRSLSRRLDQDADVQK